MAKLKKWEQKILDNKIANNLYIVTVGEVAFTARKIYGDYINSVTGDLIELPNIYRARKL